MPFVKGRVFTQDGWVSGGVMARLTENKRVDICEIDQWADDQKLLKVNLGSGLHPVEGYINVDAYNPADVTADPDDRWPFEDDSVGIFVASDIVEHLKDPIHTMNEAWRCLAHGGWFLISVPSTDGRGALQDPTHVSFWNENSFLYYTRAGLYQYIAHKANCKYQVVTLRTWFPSDWAQSYGIPYVQAHLRALKNGDEQ